MPEPIKTDLYRFMTLRTPQLLSKVRKELGFIFHPSDTSGSAMLNGLDPQADLEVQRGFIQQQVEAYTSSALNSYTQVRDIDPALYDFAAWLSKNRNELAGVDMSTKTTSLSTLSPADEWLVWDNLLYQTIRRNNKSVRQACIQVIVADYFLRTYDHNNRQVDADALQGEDGINASEPLTPDDIVDIYVKRLANAKVVISKAFSYGKTAVESKPPQLKPVWDQLLREVDLRMAQEEIAELKFLSDDLKQHEKIYKKSYRAAFDLEYANHQQLVADKIQQVIDDNPSATQEELDALIAALELPTFEFEFPLPFAPEFKDAFLADETQAFIASNCLEEGGYSDVRRVLRSLKSKSGKAAGKGKVRHQKMLMSSGVLLNNGQPSPYCYALAFRPDAYQQTNDSLAYLVIYTGRPGAFIRSGDYEINYATGLSESGTTFATTGNMNGFVSAKLFDGQHFPLNPVTSFKFDAEIKMDNGDKLTLSLEGTTDNLRHTACAQVDQAVTPVPADSLLFGVNRIGVADFRRVEQELCCYVAGEVSHIENVMAKEYKERHTRSLTRSQVTIEEATEVEVENLTDTTSTDRNELQTEISNERNRETSIAAGASLGVSATTPGNVEINVDAYFDFASSTSSSMSNSSARSQAREVTSRAVEKVIEKVSRKRTSIMLKEFEANNRHGFDNRGGEEHVSGVYRWVDKIYMNRLVNYGRRLMYEFMIPEPSRFYKFAVEAGEEVNPAIVTVEKPQTLEQLGIRTAADIDPDEYLSVAAALRVPGVIAPPPAPVIMLNHSLSPLSSLSDGDAFNDRHDLVSVPDGYIATEAETHISFVAKNNGEIAFFITEKDIDWSWTGSGTEDFGPVRWDVSWGNPLTGIIPIRVKGENALDYTFYVEVTCEPTEATMLNWQAEVYATFLSAYQDRKAEYEASLLAAAAAEAEEAAEEEANMNAAFNRTIEQREIVRLCIEMITQPFGIAMGQDMYTDDTGCGIDTKPIPAVNQTDALDDYADTVKFFEQAFDWDIISYLFYPYYWADKCKWTQLIQTQNAKDPVFQAFLQSGMARVVVPVREGFEEAVSYFMETGDVWSGGSLVMDTDDDLYLSIAEEMESEDGVVEAEWKVRVPSTLTVIQSSTIGLEASGLPCASACADTSEFTLLEPPTLTGLPNTETP